MCLSFRPQHAWNVPQWEHPRPSSHEEVSLFVSDATKTTCLIMRVIERMQMVLDLVHLIYYDKSFTYSFVLHVFAAL